ncbi:hypothetical protein [Devosia sp.]|nr:hypothetical protein [Devosia sp.]MBN9309370.1 hypothetical protein [Devosia sp.]
MSLIDARAAIARHADRPSLMARARAWLAGLIADLCAGADAPADPTASFSPREWADLPTHHPASDD